MSSIIHPTSIWLWSIQVSTMELHTCVSCCMSSTRDYCPCDSFCLCICLFTPMFGSYLIFLKFLNVVFLDGDLNSNTKHLFSNNLQFQITFWILIDSGFVLFSKHKALLMILFFTFKESQQRLIYQMKKNTKLKGTTKRLKETWKLKQKVNQGTNALKEMETNNTKIFHDSIREILFW